ncbi:iron ABC transporter permease [Desulfosporosinus fructosivorans]|uniref:Iron ABC transporter permease n=1 Tax=Desulfosporosinus fructosivorans TaxID=2018669 RepID=A0A4Z0R517_9FIRM|nr:iron chelate uptake ABC transporter family permease subunit [Desulfosporosinus fructosivorans]TGE38142.1 iron ABC transporter permease [Desulfosporosinus fructosivorans]
MEQKLKTKRIFWLTGFVALLLVSLVLGVMIGSVNLPFALTLKILLSHLPLVNLAPTWSLAQDAIVWDLRLPRVFLAIVIGAMLSSTGVAFQGMLRNPLADPYILGVSVGAAFGAASSMLFFRDLALLGYFTTPIFAFIGALLSLWFVLSLASHHGQRDRESLILAGVVVQSLIGAAISFLIAISGQQMQQIVFWMMGSLANRTWLDVAMLTPYMLVGFVYLSLQQRDLNLISLGESAATHLGMDVEKKKIKILIAGSLLTAAAVSVVGIIGFVGLIVPHLMRLIVGPDHRILLPLSTLAGAIFLLWADTVARSIIPSREIPIGVITAFIGAPFFAYLLKKGLRRGQV